MASIKHVAITGASGNIGAPLLVALQASKQLSKVTVISRSGSSATFPAGTNVVRGEYSHAFFVDAFKGVDAVVSAGSDVPGQKVMIDAAVEAGVKVFMPSQFGSDIDHPDAVKTVPIFEGKIDIQNHLREKAAASGGMFNWISLTTGEFFDWGLATVGLLSMDLAAKKVTLYDGGNGRFDVTTLSTIGLATARILENPNMYLNHAVFINSFVATQNQVVAALEKATGSKFTVNPASTDDMLREGREKIAKGNFYGNYDLLFGSGFREDGVFMNHSSYHKLANEELELPKEDLDEVVRQVVQEGRPKSQW